MTFYRNGEQKAQGDVLISQGSIYADSGNVKETVKTRDLVVGRGEKGDHEHRLTSKGEMRILHDEQVGAGQRRLVVDVPAEGAQLAHAGHGIMDIKPGQHEFIHGQREFNPTHATRVPD